MFDIGLDMRQVTTELVMQAVNAKLKTEMNKVERKSTRTKNIRAMHRTSYMY